MMKNELKVNDKDLLQVISNKGEIEALKPLMQEIYLFDTFISEINFLNNKEVLDELKSNEELKLKRNNSKFSEYEIEVYKGDIRLGLIPDTKEQLLARLMDAGKVIKAKYLSTRCENNFLRVNISIYLMDY